MRAPERIERETQRCTTDHPASIGDRHGVSEAVSNVVRHAYAGRDRTGAVALEATIVDGSLIVVISDAGHGMSATGNAGAMGLGLHLIETVAERCELHDGDPIGVRLRMSFAID